MYYKFIAILLIVIGVTLTIGGYILSPKDTLVESTTSSTSTTSLFGSHTSTMDQSNLTQYLKNSPILLTVAPGPTGGYVGNGFSINIPNGWQELLSVEKRWSFLGLAKVWDTHGGVEINVVWGEDTPNSAINLSEANDLSSLDSHFVVSTPNIKGATKTEMIAPSQLYNESYDINLYVQGKGKTYLIAGRSNTGSQTDFKELQQIMSSFTILSL